MTRLKQLTLAAMAGLALFASNAQAGYSRSEAGYGGYQVAYNFRDTSGATVLVTDDDALAIFALPFAFTFYGQEYAAGSQGWVSTNGLLGFGLNVDNAHCCSGLPSNRSPAHSVQAGWFDLVGSISSQTTGAIGNREFVFTWSGREFGGAAGGNQFQAILREAGDDVEFQFARLNAMHHTASVGGIRGDDTTAGINFIDSASGVSLANLGLLVSTRAPGAEVPEPGAVALLGLGLAGFALSRRKSKRAAR